LTARKHTIVGTLEVLESIQGPRRQHKRDVLVHLPWGYEESERRYPVLYMHDGQNLFDEETAFDREWQVDETMRWLHRWGVDAIVVGIPNMGDARLDEYSPFRDTTHGGGGGDRYLDWLVDKVKPVVDDRFRTLRSRRHTGIAGSSMGGLISLYAYFRHPDVFGFAGVLSPALWFGDRAIFPYVQGASYVAGRLYLDVGVREGVRAVNDVRRLHTALLRKGFRPGDHLLYVEDLRGGHSELAWRRRIRPALYFLIPRSTRSD
jgi:predicted alpha/beta superfamily hydrolase